MENQEQPNIKPAPVVSQIHMPPLPNRPNNIKMSIIIIIIGFLIIFGLIIFATKFIINRVSVSHEVTGQPVQTITLTPTPGIYDISPTPSPKSSPVIYNSPTPVVKIQPTATSIPATSAPVPTATPTPRVPNPPIIDISYPSEMQTITSSSSSICVVDVPAGGNTSGVQRKNNINDAGWTSYSDMSTLCFNPITGLNKIQLQYKNGFGDESSVYTRQFTFQPQ